MLIALVLVLTGCTHTRSTGFNGEGSYAEINRLGSRKEATVTLAVEQYIVGRQSMVTGQRDIKVSHLQMALDSTSWLEPRTGRFETVATARIRAVRIVARKNHGRGALIGLGEGLLMGAAFGALLGFAGGDDPPCQSGTGFCWRFTAGETAAFGAVVLGAVGGSLGALIGLLVGSEEIYRFSAPALPPQVAADETQQK